MHMPLLLNLEVKFPSTLSKHKRAVWHVIEVVEGCGLLSQINQSKAFSSPQARYASGFGRVLKAMLTSHHHSSFSSHSAMCHVYTHN